MCQLAQTNERLCAITAAMPTGTGLLGFKDQFPHRFFDVGIAEEHAVSMAGGLAKQGMVPVVALYSTFLQRAYDMILQDICMLGLHVVFAIDRAGLVGEDGETHHGVFDVGFLRQAPGMMILCPASMSELASMLSWAVCEHNGPVAIRYPRGSDRNYTDNAWCNGGTNSIVCHQDGDEVAILTYGTFVQNAMDAASILLDKGVSAKVLRLMCIHPASIEEITEKLKNVKYLFIVEEIAGCCGIGDSLANKLNSALDGIQVQCFDLGNKFVPHGSVNKLYCHCALDGQSVADRILEVLSHEK